MRRLPLILIGMAIVLALASVALAQQPAAQPAAPPVQQPKDTNFFERFFGAYVDEFREAPSNEPEPPRRALPAPLDSPPFPSSEWQGFPLVGVPYGTKEYPLTKALWGTPGIGDFLREQRIKVYGWINASGNWSDAKDSNMPTSYWIFPNEPVLNQAILRFEREVDSVQQDHIDWGFRSTWLYGTDYRYMTSGGSAISCWSTTANMGTTPRSSTSTCTCPAWRRVSS